MSRKTRLLPLYFDLPGKVLKTKENRQNKSTKPCHFMPLRVQNGGLGVRASSPQAARMAALHGRTRRSHQTAGVAARAAFFVCSRYGWKSPCTCRGKQRIFPKYTMTFADLKSPVLLTRLGVFAAGWIAPYLIPANRISAAEAEAVELHGQQNETLKSIDTHLMEIDSHLIDMSRTLGKIEERSQHQSETLKQLQESIQKLTVPVNPQP